MNVGSYLRGKSTFTTHPNRHVSYGELYGKTYGNIKSPSFSDEHNKRNPLYVKRIALFEKS